MSFTATALPDFAGGGVAIPAAIEAWVRSDALAELMRPFGGTPPIGSLAKSLAQLEAFSEVWNYRGGLERSNIKPIDYPDAIDDLVAESARALGLAGRHQPRRDKYDYVLVLGGGPRTALARPAFAHELSSRGVNTGHLSVLSSLRALTKAEVGIATGLGLPPVRLETEAMAVGLIRAFAISTEYEERSGITRLGAEWCVREFDCAEFTVDVIAAPTSNPPHRANTADTYDGWATYAATPGPTDRVLVVTTDLYVPFQHCDAVRLLSLTHGCEVETVGLNPADYPDWLQISTQTAILQEVRSAIRSMRGLHDAWCRQR